MIVADTNLSAYFSIPSPYSDWAQQLHASDPHWIAPALWRSEIRSVLTQHVAHARLTLRQALQRLGELELMFDQRLFEVPSAEVLKLATESACSSYDCEFVVLARQKDCLLITMDTKLVKAFPETARLLTDC